MNKKYIVLGLGGVVIIVVGVYLWTLQSPRQQGNTQAVATSPSPIAPGYSGTTQAGKNNTTIIAASPEDTTKSFYTWYLGSAQNPISTGSYKTSPYLTDHFKSNIDGFAQNYNPQYDPIFCTVNQTQSYNISKAISSDNQTKVTVQITDKNVDAPKPLYNVILVQVNGVWKIDDIMCE
jgi:hypothetical protein